MTVEVEDSSTGNDREGSPVAAKEVEGDDDGKVQESSDASCQRSSDSAGQKDSSGHGSEVDPSGFAAIEEGKKGMIKEDDSDRNKGEEQDGVNVEGKKIEARKGDKQGNMAASEKEDSDGGKEERGSGDIEDRDTPHIGNRPGILLVDCVRWPVEELERGCSVTAELMESLRRVFVDSVSNSFYPVPQEAIGVGSAFEGWSPREWDGVYRVLVPLSPPPGHAFCLELNSAGQMAARSFRVHVERVCTCQREQLGQELLCVLHHSQKELRRKHQRSLLRTLCTGSYLDVEKTSHWFSQLVRSLWLHVPQSSSWHLVFQPCGHSCQFQLSDGKESLRVEMLFGVHQGDSDIFVVSQPSEAQRGGSSILGSSQPAKANVMASTAWPETYTVAEAKFFRHITRQVPCESLHLKCLQVFTCILRGTGFSSSVWKTVVKHVLTTVLLSQWHRKEFARWLWDIMAYLGHCLQLKRLEHFVLGNERLPAEISLPPAMRKVEPLNLFEHLARDAAAHREAMQAYGQLQFRLWELLSSH
ncbi:inositol 1,4,5-trisphosphate receptor-interacting protein-like 1 [Chamaea fasciata]|uniref:inositol 1,4,5-trisphosphate receptor-interacting protein-like 1 n=1 Tax=Chamaea fasciata TaxID=190680 RepID=UPI00336A98E2